MGHVRHQEVLCTAGMQTESVLSVVPSGVSGSHKLVLRIISRASLCRAGQGQGGSEGKQPLDGVGILPAFLVTPLPCNDQIAQYHQPDTPS